MADRGNVKSADAFRTISEVSKELDVPQHVLRFWETKFTQIKPMKRAGGRRYYRPDDVALIIAIKNLLHDDGYTIKGVQKLLKDRGVKAVVDVYDSDESLQASEEEGMRDQDDDQTLPLPFGEAPAKDDKQEEVSATAKKPSEDAPSLEAPVHEVQVDREAEEEIAEGVADDKTGIAADALTTDQTPQIVYGGLSDDERTHLNEVVRRLKEMKHRMEQLSQATLD